jgi:hypothetical protein
MEVLKVAGREKMLEGVKLKGTYTNEFAPEE